MIKKISCYILVFILFSFLLFILDMFMVLNNYEYSFFFACTALKGIFHIQLFIVVLSFMIIGLIIVILIMLRKKN